MGGRNLNANAAQIIVFIKDAKIINIATDVLFSGQLIIFVKNNDDEIPINANGSMSFKIQFLWNPGINRECTSGGQAIKYMAFVIAQA